jgi:hypothetical protein
MRTLHLAALSAILLAAACAASQEPAPPPPAEEPAIEASAAEEAAPVVKVRDARAEEVVLAMSDALKKAGTFSLHVESWSDEETADGTLLSLPGEARLLVRRPDGLFVERTSERGVRHCWYDGKNFTVLDVAKNLYARIDAPETIEKTIDLLADKYGVVMPLADLLADDPSDSYGRVADRVEYLGTQTVRGASCHHIAFAAPWLQWQVWIAAEGDPLPKRVQITYADELGKPRFLAYLDEWKLGPAVEASAFAFTEPAGARKIEFAPVDSGADQDR